LAEKDDANESFKANPGYQNFSEKETENSVYVTAAEIAFSQSPGISMEAIIIWPEPLIEKSEFPAQIYVDEVT
jgi:hypothetical protein